MKNPQNMTLEELTRLFRKCGDKSVKDVFNMTEEESNAMVDAYRLKHPENMETIETFSKDLCKHTTPAVKAFIDEILGE